MRQACHTIGRGTRLLPPHRPPDYFPHAAHLPLRQQRSQLAADAERRFRCRRPDSDCILRRAVAILAVFVAALDRIAAAIGRSRRILAAQLPQFPLHRLPPPGHIGGVDKEHRPHHGKGGNWLRLTACGRGSTPGRRPPYGPGRTTARPRPPAAQTALCSPACSPRPAAAQSAAPHRFAPPSAPRRCRWRRPAPAACPGSSRCRRLR